MKQTEYPPRAPKLPALLPLWGSIVLVVTLLLAACTGAPGPSPQPDSSGVGTTAPTIANKQPVATAEPATEIPASPSAAPTSTTAPTDTSVPTSTVAPSNTSEPTIAPTEAITSPIAPTQPPATDTQPQTNLVTFQIQNRTDRTIYVFGYGMDKSIPSGLIVYFQAPDWGAISLKICHKNRDDSLGCYNYNGTISPSSPMIEIKK